MQRRGDRVYSLAAVEGEFAVVAEIFGIARRDETVTDAVETIVDTYVGLRQDGETFLDAYRRVGPDPFKEAVYATH